MSERAIRRRHERARESEAERSSGSRSTRVAAGAAVAIGSTVLFADGASAVTYNVTNLNDAGPGSLRDAFAQANATAADDMITFQSGLTGTITLTTGQLVAGTSSNANGALIVEGPGADQLTVSGNNSSRIISTEGPNVGGIGPAFMISGLTLTDGSSSNGGALFAYDRAVTIRDVVLTGNSSTGRGGAISSDGFSSSLTIEGTEVTGNTATGRGGGLYNEDTLPSAQLQIQISDSEFSGNTAGTTGGGIHLYDPDAPVLIKDTTVSGNDATGKGGGIYLYDTDGGPFEIDSSTISGNSASDGGGVYARDPDDPVLIENTTVADNETTGAVGGILIRDQNVGGTIDGSTIASNEGIGFQLNNDAVTLKNSIVADNEGATDLAGAGTFNTDFDLIETPGAVTLNVATPGSNKTGVAPQLGPLVDNGGPTETILPQPGSPALDAANTALSVDERGLTRPVNLTKVAPGIGNQSDMGAVEIQAIANTVLPAISGQAAVGQTLTANQGQWSGGPTGFKYQWLRCDSGGANCAPVGANQPTYAVTTADIGKTIRVDVTAENGYTESGPVRAVATLPVPGIGVIDPVLTMADPQVQNGGGIAVRVIAGAGENVQARAGGKIFVGKGNAVGMQAEAVTSGQQVTLVLKPKSKDGKKRIKKALKNGRKVTAKINASLTNDRGEVFSKQLQAKLKK